MTVRLLNLIMSCTLIRIYVKLHNPNPRPFCFKHFHKGPCAHIYCISLSRMDSEIHGQG